MENEIVKEIKKLKCEKNAVILAHYYAPDEVQAVADYVGDSFYLAKIAKKSEADVIVFCGVYFMGESAKILNPGKTVLMPDITADCPMAHMVSDGKIEKIRNSYDDLAVVCYINSDVRLKCKSDVCVTSSNAVKIVKNLSQKNIFFIPDKNLGRYVSEQVTEKNIILNDGYCPLHTAIKAEHISAVKKLHREAAVLSHPECSEDVLALSDYIGSTAEIISYVNTSNIKEFIICTESGVGCKLKKDNPDKSFYFIGGCSECSDMKLNSPEKIYDVLKTGKNEVKISENICKKAMVPLNKMLEMAK